MGIGYHIFELAKSINLLNLIVNCERYNCRFFSFVIVNGIKQYNVRSKLK
jgi:hypothetical protein